MPESGPTNGNATRADGVYSSRAGELVALLGEYRAARRAFLASLEIPESNRDPLAEFAERLVHALLGGELASSRVQKGYDLITLAGEKVQVKYLTNPVDREVNGHEIRFDETLDLYSLVIIEALDLVGVVTFSRETIGEVCGALGKRHGNQDRSLQLTRNDYRRIIASPAYFETLGVGVFTP